MAKALVFNVEEAQDTTNTSDWVTYRHFIERFRRSFPLIYFAKNLMADIVLQTYTHEVRLRLDICDFYILGYQMENSEQWLGFGVEYKLPMNWKRMVLDPTARYGRIVGCSSLGFYHGYIALEDKIKETMDSINLGQEQLTNAINLLATSTNTRDRVWSLLVVKLMICEGLRFDSVCNYVAATFLDTLPAPTGMLQLVQKYGDDSFPYDGDSGFNPNIRDNSMFQNLSSGDDRTEYEGQLAQFYATGYPCMNSKRTLVEVFSVSINSINGGEFYGTITATDGMYSEVIYHREKDDGETLSYGDSLLLSGPTRSLWGCCQFGINLELMGESVPKIDSHYYGQISWDYRERKSGRNLDKCDKPLVDDFDGKYCSVTVNFIVFKRAVQASVEITIINDDRRRKDVAARVYGQICAWCDKIEYDYRSDKIEYDYRSVLFRKKAKEHIDVGPGEPLKLLRSVVAVAAFSTFCVRAELYDYNGDLHSDDDEVANDATEFLVEPFGTFDENIYGKHGEIQVKVTFE